MNHPRLVFAFNVHPPVPAAPADVVSHERLSSSSCASARPSAAPPRSVHLAAEAAGLAGFARPSRDPGGEMDVVRNNKTNQCH